MQTHDPHNAHRDPHRWPADECTAHHHGAPHDGTHDCRPPYPHHRPPYPEEAPRPPLRNINHKEDFPLPLTLRDSRGVPLRIPDYDFTVRLIAGSVEYFAGRFNGKFSHCRPAAHDPHTLVIFCEDHGLPPCPELMAEITYHIPDADYCKGTRDIVRRQPTGVCLTVRRSDLPGWADFDGVPMHPGCAHEVMSQDEIDDWLMRFEEIRPNATPPHPGGCGCTHTHVPDVTSGS